MAKPSLQIVENEEPGLGKPLPVKLSRIERYAEQPRRYFDPKSLEELADDIQIDGQRTPVSVCRNSAKGGVFILIGGERRLRAFGIIRDRTGTDPIVNCFIDTVNDERHHFRKAFLDNIQREDLIPLDEAAAYRRLFNESTGESHHAKVVEVARLSKKSTSHVENYLELDTLPDSVKKLMNPELPKDEQLSRTSAVDIARSTNDPALRLALAQEAIERGLDLAEVRMLISVKTGKSGYGIGGRMRKPADDYKAFKIFLGGALNRARRIRQGIDINGLYANRDQDLEDRKRDARIIRELVSHLNDLLKDVESEGGGS